MYIVRLHMLFFPVFFSFGLFGLVRLCVLLSVFGVCHAFLKNDGLALQLASRMQPSQARDRTLRPGGVDIGIFPPGP